MTKILNLDKIQTKREKVIILNGEEHLMKIFTVKEYIYHMKKAEKLTKLNSEDIDTLGAGLSATIDILMGAFPTVKREQFENLNMEQLTAIRGLIEEENDSDTAELSEEGEAPGETV